jgi:hypothetical protein
MPTFYNGDNAGRGLSPGLWSNCPFIGDVRHDTNLGWFFFDDFTGFPLTANATAQAAIGNYKYFTSSSADPAIPIVEIGAAIGTGKMAYIPGGILQFASDGDDEGCSLASMAMPCQITRNGGRFWFEARLVTTTIADTKHGFVIGVAQTYGATLGATVPIAAAGTLADINFVGFHRLEGDGDKLDTIYKADGVTQVTVKADAITLVASTWLKVGMLYEPRDGKLYYYLNGVPLLNSKTIPSATGTDFPADVGLGLIFGLLNATGTTPGFTYVDWWGCAQLAT